MNQQQGGEPASARHTLSAAPSTSAATIQKHSDAPVPVAPAEESQVAQESWKTHCLQVLLLSRILYGTYVVNASLAFGASYTSIRDQYLCCCFQKPSREETGTSNVVAHSYARYVVTPSLHSLGGCSPLPPKSVRYDNGERSRDHASVVMPD